jgi:type I restriction enzyme R subunit
MPELPLSERDVCSQRINPALQESGWDFATQVREEYTLTAGRIMVRGNAASREQGRRADYVLFHKPNIPLAVIEAKGPSHSVGDGMQQGLAYAESLDVPYVFSTNGTAFLFHDRTAQSGTVEREIPMNEFPSPEAIWDAYRSWKGIEEEHTSLVAQDYHSDNSGKEPRYYQVNAINRTVEAIAKGKNRALLVMATGTGKTYVSFQIIWRLWKAGLKKRILFLADRNILVDQTRTNDFKPFGGAMTKIKNRNIDKSYEIFLSLYQAITGPEEEQKVYKEFSRDFFDLIVIDECHRGSAEDDSAWREILEYFSSATQLGLTATPKETRYVSNIDYFEDPVYTYSLKQGIHDGFLAPYKVIRLGLDKDLMGFRPTKGQKDRDGNEIPDEEYFGPDFDRNLVLDERTKLVAAKIKEYLDRTGDPYQKTIIFCEDIDHAERMRQAIVNGNAPLVAENHRYVMRITGDNQEGKAELDNFIHPGKRYPCIATTSRLMSTGVDAQTCKIIVLDRSIKSMTEFKQIIGRGTRVKEDFGKLFFTIMDFRNATKLFADPEFDGDPVQIFEGLDDDDDDGDDQTGEGPQDTFGPTGGTTLPPSEPRIKYYVDDVEVTVVSQRVQYLDADGKLITESLQDYTRKTLGSRFTSLDEFLSFWKESDRKKAVVEELETQGLLLESLREEVGRDFDPFDLVCHVAFDQPPLTRRERAENVRKRHYFAKHGDQARAVLEALLAKYADEGIVEMENIEVLRLKPFDEIGTPVQILQAFGGREPFLEAVRELQQELYVA